MSDAPYSKGHDESAIPAGQNQMPQAPPSYTPMNGAQMASPSDPHQQQQGMYQPMYPQFQQAGQPMYPQLQQTGQPIMQQPGQPMMMVQTGQPMMQQPIIMSAPLGPISQRMNCPSCSESVVTRVEHVSSGKTHLIAGGICCLTVWLCCCCLGLIPYCEFFSLKIIFVMI